MVSPRTSVAAEQEMTDLADKSVIISGGTKGIGRATAKLLAEHGAKVFIFGRHEKELRETLDELGAGAHGITADQSRREDIERVFAEADRAIGGCDILINNAAVSTDAVADADFDQIRYTLEANVLGYLACTHEALERMKRRAGNGFAGHIVNVGSMSADLREEEGEIYVATKAAIQAFSESLRKSVNKQNIRVTLIEPGAVDTPLQDKPPEEKRRRVEEMKMLPPEDIARCILYCLTQPQRVDIVSVQIRPIGQAI